MATKLETGELLRRWRLWAGLTRADLAASIDVTEGAIGHYERCVRFPSMDKLEAMISAIGISRSTFFASPPKGCR